MGKKGLAIIYDPHNLYQFIWYYCSKDCNINKKWDALCLPNGYKGEYMHEYCGRAKIFSTIFQNKTEYLNFSIIKKMTMFFMMFLYFIIGKRKIYCKKLLNKFVNIDDYNEIVIIASVGIVSGACCSLGDEKKVIILEDSLNDYSDRRKFIEWKKINSFYCWQGLILAYMGYCSPGWYYLKTEQFCIKYCHQPALMKFHGYKELRQLFQDSKTNWNNFRLLLKRIYPEIEQIEFEKTDAIVFTRPLSDFVVQPEPYKKKIEEFISSNYKTVLLKKHPRESEEYSLIKTKTVIIDNAIPAEVILPYLSKQDIVMITPSGILISLPVYGLKCKIVDLEGLYEESKNQNTLNTPMSIDELREYCDKFAYGSYEIITI